MFCCPFGKGRGEGERSWGRQSNQFASSQPKSRDKNNQSVKSDLLIFCNYNRATVFSVLFFFFGLGLWSLLCVFFPLLYKPRQKETMVEVVRRFRGADQM